MGTARVLFAGVGLLWVVIGVLAPILTGRGLGSPMVFLSPRTDTALYGGPPDEVLEQIPQLGILRDTTVKGALAGMLAAAGVLAFAMAWFGLEQPSGWVLMALTIVGVGVIPYWWVALAPYRSAGIPIGITDMPPFMWVPALVMPIASILGWVGYLRG